MQRFQQGNINIWTILYTAIIVHTGLRVGNKPTRFIRDIFYAFVRGQLLEIYENS